jgi:enoyl-CoA hydratase
MEIILTGRNFSAKEAAEWGLVSRVVSDTHEETLAEAVKVAEKICDKGRLSVIAAKEAVGAGASFAETASFLADYTRVIWLPAFELPLGSGLKFERRLFHMLFATVSGFCGRIINETKYRLAE